MAKEWHGVRGGRQQKTWILSFIIALSLESFAGIYDVTISSMMSLETTEPLPPPPFPLV